MEKFVFKPKGVCSRKMEFEIEDGKLASLSVEGGCNGNLQGISSLVKGKDIDEVISCLEGIECHPRKTSCPDQIAKALREFQTR